MLKPFFLILIVFGISTEDLFAQKEQAVATPTKLELHDGNYTLTSGNPDKCGGEEVQMEQSQNEDGITLSIGGTFLFPSIDKKSVTDNDVNTKCTFVASHQLLPHLFKKTETITCPDPKDNLNSTVTIVVLKDVVTVSVKNVTPKKNKTVASFKCIYKFQQEPKDDKK